MRFLAAVLTILTFALSASAASKTVNLRYNLGTGPMLEFGMKKIGIGLMYDALSFNLSDTSSEFKGSKMGARFSLYSNGMGASSWYMGLDAGQVKVDVKDKVTEATGSNTSMFYGLAGGYHWFWGMLNLNLGLGFMSLNIGDTEVKDGSGTVVDSVKGIAIGLPMIDLGLGLAF